MHKYFVKDGKITGQRNSGRSAAEFRTGASISGSNPIPSVRQWTVTPVTAVWCGYRFQRAARPSSWECETMHRARASEVRGNKVLVDGAWLTCIGNRSVYPGEWIWTDGRCVYGHESEGGSSYVSTDVLSGIPILRCAWKDNKALTRYLLCERKTSRFWLWQRRRVDGQSRRSFCIF